MDGRRGAGGCTRDTSSSCSDRGPRCTTPGSGIAGCQRPGCGAGAFRHRQGTSIGRGHPGPGTTGHAWGSVRRLPPRACYGGRNGSIQQAYPMQSPPGLGCPFVLLSPRVCHCFHSTLGCRHPVTTDRPPGRRCSSRQKRQSWAVSPQLPRGPFRRASPSQVLGSGGAARQ